MVSHIHTFAFSGIDVTDVEVQVQLSSGNVAFTIVGLPDKAVNEAKERVRAALGSMGLSMPPKRITVNLAPAGIAKEGSHYDLAIIIGLLMGMHALPDEELESYVVMGELSLDGSLMPIGGILPAAIGASARNKGIICPAANGGEAAWAGDIDILAPTNVLELINHFKGTQLLTKPVATIDNDPPHYPDMRDIKGQETAKRALEIAAAGGHNILMVGPPGSGKSMLASRLPGIMPQLTSEEMLEVSMVNSIAGNLIDGKITRRRPFRDPHHNCSMPAMIGGGSRARPGEVTLAHKGILFLDELPEFPGQVLDSLRQPLETRNVTIARVQSHVTFPADFQLVAAMNPCRCGYLEDASRACSRAPRCANDYQARLSGPLLDRIDIHIEVPEVKPFEIYNSKEGEDSATIAKRVARTREVQAERYSTYNERHKGSFRLNSEADGDALEEFALPDVEGRELLEQAVEVMGLSMRGHNRVLRVARTIADMAGADKTARHHIAEALTYRQISYNRERVSA